MNQITWHSEKIATLDQFLTPDECQNHIATSEKHGFERALINARGAAQRNEDVRDNDRLIFDNLRLAESLWGKMSGLLPTPFFHRWEPIGLNERIKIYRYAKGQKFDWHKDAPFIRPDETQSLLTMLVYLNDDFTGGNTIFGERQSDRVSVTQSVPPKKGSALLFFHPLLHQGEAISAGTKYVLRTDVMFKPLPL